MGLRIYRSGLRSIPDICSKQGHIWRREGQQNQTYGAFGLPNVTGRKTDPHYAVDILGTPNVTEVEAAHKGIVTITGKLPNSPNAGLTVYIEHDFKNEKYRTAYMHLNKIILVKTGEEVKEGQHLAFLAQQEMHYT